MNHNYRFYISILILTLLPVAIVATSQVMTYRPSAYRQYPTITPIPVFNNVIEGIELVAYGKYAGQGRSVIYNIACESAIRLRVTVQPYHIESIQASSPYAVADFKVVNKTNPRQKLPVYFGLLTKKTDPSSGVSYYQTEVLWSKTTPGLTRGSHWEAQATIKVRERVGTRQMFTTVGYSNIASFSIDNYKPPIPCSPY